MELPKPRHEWKQRAHARFQGTQLGICTWLVATYQQSENCECMSAWKAIRAVKRMDTASARGSQRAQADMSDRHVTGKFGALSLLSFDVSENMPLPHWPDSSRWAVPASYGRRSKRLDRLSEARSTIRSASCCPAPAMEQLAKRSPILRREHRAGQRRKKLAGKVSPNQRMLRRALL